MPGFSYGRFWDLNPLDSRVEKRLRLIANFFPRNHASFIGEKGNTRMFFHFYDRKRNGVPTLGDLSISWTGGGWPKL